MPTKTKISNRSSGFTLIELLTVIAIIGILASILIPVVGRVREQANRAHCGSNIRQIALALHNYAEEHRGYLPDYTKQNGVAYSTVSAQLPGNWPWDVPKVISKELLSNAAIDTFYCPSSSLTKDVSLDVMFNKFSSNFSVTSYVLVLKGSGGANRIRPEWTADNDKIKDYYKLYPNQANSKTVPASMRVLVADAVLKQGRSDYTGISGGLHDSDGNAVINPTNHLGKKYPLGCNVAFMDAHVKWTGWGAKNFNDVTGWDKTNGSPAFAWPDINPNGDSYDF